MSSSIKEITLYSYFYSSASWRIRSVLAIKKIPFKYETVHLLDGKQHSEEYLKINPMHQVPAMKIVDNDGKAHFLTQSLAIIDYLEEMYPNDPIYPKDKILKAKSKAIADTICAGIQPLQNLETLLMYTEPIKKLVDRPLKPDERKEVAQFWIDRKLKNLELLVKKTAGKYCVGDQVTVADISLIPQMLNARRFGLDTNNYPLLQEIDSRLQELDWYKAGHPFSCPDAPKQQ